MADYQRTAQQLIQDQGELTALKEDKLVDWGWVCDYFGVSRTAVRIMLENEKIFCYGRQVKRFEKADIVRFAERHCIKARDLLS